MSEQSPAQDIGPVQHIENPIQENTPQLDDESFMDAQKEGVEAYLEKNSKVLPNDKKKLLKKKRAELRKWQRIKKRARNKVLKQRAQGFIDELTIQIDLIKKLNLKSEMEVIGAYNKYGDHSLYKDKGFRKSSPITGRKVDYSIGQHKAEPVFEKSQPVSASRAAGGEYVSPPIAIPEGAQTIRLFVNAYLIRDKFELWGKSSGKPFNIIPMMRDTHDTGAINIPFEVIRQGALILKIFSEDPKVTQWTYRYQFGIREKIKKGELGIKSIYMKDLKQRDDRKKKKK